MHILLFAPHDPRIRMGGAELQTLLLAKGLVNHAHQVTFVVTKGDFQSIYRDGETNFIVVPGWQKIGEKSHRDYLRKVIDRTEPDICYVRAFYELSDIASICKTYKIPAISCLVNLLDTQPIGVNLNPIRFFNTLKSGILMRHLRSFAAIPKYKTCVCNSRTIQLTIQKWYPSMNTQVIYNGHPAPPVNEIHKISTGKVIWVNNIKRWKRAETFIQLSKYLPDYCFFMVGKLYSDRYGRKIKEQINKATNNFTYEGSQSLDWVNEKICESDLLLYTSTLREGFGNSLIQAWMRCVPTVSLEYDPDGIIKHEHLGRVSSDFPELVKDVKEMMENEGLRSEMGKNARDYAIKHHSLEQMVIGYESLFLTSIKNS